MVEPVDIASSLEDPQTYEQTILRVFEKRRQRGLAFTDAEPGVTYFATATGRRTLSQAIAGSVTAGRYQPEPVDLWFLESKGKTRAAHMPNFTDHVLGAALYQLLSRNARCYGLPGVYSYLPGLTNTTAMRALAEFVRAHREGRTGTPMYVAAVRFRALWRRIAGWPGCGVLADPAGGRNLGQPERRATRGDLGSGLRSHPTGGPRRRRGTVHPGRGRPDGHSAGSADLESGRGADGPGGAGNRGNLLRPLQRRLRPRPPRPRALHEADRRIDAVLPALGVKRKQAKEIRTALSATGMPSTADPAYRGGNRIDCLGLSVSHAGTVTVGPHRLRRFMARVTDRIDGAATSLAGLPVAERGRHLVAAANVMLDVASPFAIPGLSAILDTTTDRGVLKDLDFRIARKIVQAATGRPGVHGFRLLPPGVLRGQMGLESLVRLRNLR